MKKIILFTLIAILSIVIIVNKNETKKIILEKSGMYIDSWSNDFECTSIKSCDISYLTVKPDAKKKGGAKLSIAKNRKYDGDSSLHSYVPMAKFEGKGFTSKAMIARKEFTFLHGDNIVAEEWLYIPSSSKGRVTLMDIETSKKSAALAYAFRYRKMQ